MSVSNASAGDDQEGPTYMGDKWSESDEKKPPADRESLAVYWAVDTFAWHLQAGQFTFVRDCSASI